MQRDRAGAIPSEVSNTMLYVVGGELDPNIGHFQSALRRQRRKFTSILVGPGAHPSLHWDLSQDTLHVDGHAVTPTAVFLRYDVFANLADQRAETAYRAHCWYTSVEGWLVAHPTVGTLNRQYCGTTNKVATLCLAREMGLPIPRTLLSNDVTLLQAASASSKLVVKPVIGGEYTMHLRDVLPDTPKRGRSGAAPAIVQEELVPPDIRIYQIGRHQTAFRITSNALDYRIDANCLIQPMRVIGSELRRGLRQLTDALGLNFAAADFKVNARTGTIEFLEVNSAPMFAAFDQIVDGALSSHIVELLDRATLLGSRRKLSRKVVRSRDR